MQTIIVTTGTSLVTNRDARPWAGQSGLLDSDVARDWLRAAAVELISAETNTLWRLDPKADDEVVLLCSQTEEGRSCAAALVRYFAEALGQRDVRVVELPGLNYDSESTEPALARMATLVEQLVSQARFAHVTLAATGGFKSEVMMLALVGAKLGVPVCYLHERFKSLVYMPRIAQDVPPVRRVSPAPLPVSSRVEGDKVQLSAVPHHRPASWPKVERLLAGLPWVDAVRYDAQAASAPRNGVKGPDRLKTTDGCAVLWLHLYDDDEHRLPLRIETTGHLPEHLAAAAAELRERLGRLF